MGKVDYRNGCWTFESETMIVYMNDATYQRHLQAHLQALGIDTRTYSELLDYTNQVLSQRIEVAKQLKTPDYWLSHNDPAVRIIRKLCGRS